MSMVIDIHTHLALKEIYPITYLNGMFGEGASRMNKQGIDAILSLFMTDNSCERLIRQMDMANIQRAVLLIIDGGMGMQEPPFSLEDIYTIHFQILLRYPERFLVFAGVDPRRGVAGLKLFEKSIIKFGFKGIKLYPPMGYSMDDRRLYDYYELCSANNLSVLIHTGPSLLQLRNEYAAASNVYNISRQFPNVNFILAHAGLNPNALEEKILSLPNVYLDIAGFQSIILTD
ncbi:MAG: hypothetical protein EOO43_23775, partial [Flavobacterium sp.]